MLHNYIWNLFLHCSTIFHGSSSIYSAEISIKINFPKFSFNLQSSKIFTVYNTCVPQSTLVKSVPSQKVYHTIYLTTRDHLCSSLQTSSPISSSHSLLNFNFCLPFASKPTNIASSSARNTPAFANITPPQSTGPSGNRRRFLHFSPSLPTSRFGNSRFNLLLCFTPCVPCLRYQLL